MVAVADVPLDSDVRGMKPQADYWDAFAIDLADPPPTALDAYLAYARRSPGWIDFLMALRNRAVRLLGLKDVGLPGNVQQRPGRRPASGERVGMFTLRSVRDEEAVLEIIDSHLDVIVSVHLAPGTPARLTVSSLVFNHNWIGRLYMVPVAPMHRLVVRAMLGRHA